MQTWMLVDVPVSDDSRVIYCGRDTAVSSLQSQSSHSGFPVALKLLLFLGKHCACALQILGYICITGVRVIIFTT